MKTIDDSNMFDSQGKFVVSMALDTNTVPANETKKSLYYKTRKHTVEERNHKSSGPLQSVGVHRPNRETSKDPIR